MKVVVTALLCSNTTPVASRSSRGPQSSHSRNSTRRRRRRLRLPTPTMPNRELGRDVREHEPLIALPDQLPAHTPLPHRHSHVLPHIRRRTPTRTTKPLTHSRSPLASISADHFVGWKLLALIASTITSRRRRFTPGRVLSASYRPRLTVDKRSERRSNASRSPCCIAPTVTPAHSGCSANTSHTTDTHRSRASSDDEASDTGEFMRHTIAGNPTFARHHDIYTVAAGHGAQRDAEDRVLTVFPSRNTRQPPARRTYRTDVLKT